MRKAREDELRKLEERLGYRFADLELLDRALTHTSRANEDHSGRARHNEPLEFLGDAVIGLVVADLLHRRDPEGSEGEQEQGARARSSPRPTWPAAPGSWDCPTSSSSAGGKRRRADGTRPRSGRTPTKRFSPRSISTAASRPPTVSCATSSPATSKGRGTCRTPRARSRSCSRAEARASRSTSWSRRRGPSHRRRFLVECRVQGTVVAEGEGHSKKEAQQEAARRALVRLRGAG